MAGFDYFSGRKISGNHAKIIPGAKKVVNFLDTLDCVEKIIPGRIHASRKRGEGRILFKKEKNISRNPRNAILKIRKGGCEQEVCLFGEVFSIKKALQEKFEGDFSFPQEEHRN
ncbi:MAG: hypothetical protein EOM19_06560 [Candidatus Moranbacteria bacterium]|nr:hypothetical protein [Candidatus Moranbacteria bacterium]